MFELVLSSKCATDRNQVFTLEAKPAKKRFCDTSLFASDCLSSMAVSDIEKQSAQAHPCAQSSSDKPLSHANLVKKEYSQSFQPLDF